MRTEGLTPKRRRSSTSRRRGTGGRVLPYKRPENVQTLCAVMCAEKATRRVLEAAQKLRLSLMQWLFTYGPVRIDEAQSVRLKPTEIGSVPEEWMVIQMRDAIEAMVTGDTPDSSVPEFWDGDFPWIAGGAIGVNDVLLLRPQRNITQKGLEVTGYRIAKRGELIFSRTSIVGKAVVAVSDVAINESLWGIKLTEDLDPLFVAYYFKTSPAQGEVVRRTRGTLIGGMHREDLYEIAIPVPPASDQKQIVGVLFAIDQKIRAEEQRLAALGELLHSLFQSVGLDKYRGRRLLSKCVEGGCDVAGNHRTAQREL